MDQFYDQLASDIINEVRNELEQKTKSGNTPVKPFTGRYHNSVGGAVLSMADQRPIKRAKNQTQKEWNNIKGKLETEDEKDIDKLADRLTSDIINHATSGGEYFFLFLKERRLKYTALFVYKDKQVEI
jgi:hypothetical protein